MTVTEMVLTLTIMTCAGSVIGMLYIYRSMETSLSILSACLNEMIVKQGVVKYGAGIPGVAKDPEVAE